MFGWWLMAYSKWSEMISLSIRRNCAAHIKEGYTQNVIEMVDKPRDYAHSIGT